MNNVYYLTKESVAEYIRLADNVDGQSLIEKLTPYLSVDSRILEIGSGPGTDYQILHKTYQVVGSDFSEEFLKHLRTTYPNGEFLHLDAARLSTKKNFDAIYSNKVLHHLRIEELKTSIENQYNILLPNGIIGHSFWKGKDSEIFKGLFVQYHTKDSLRNLFKSAFEILHLKEYTEFENGDSIFLIARKKSQLSAA